MIRVLAKTLELPAARFSPSLQMILCVGALLCRIVESVSPLSCDFVALTHDSYFSLKVLDIVNLLRLISRDL